MPSKASAKPSALAKQRIRRRDVEDMLFQRYPHRQIVDSLSEKHECSEDTVRRDIAALAPILERDMAMKRPQRKQAHRQTLEWMARRALKRGDASSDRVAERCYDQIARLDGMYAPSELVVESTVQGSMKTTTTVVSHETPAQQREKLKAAIAEALRQAPKKG